MLLFLTNFLSILLAGGGVLALLGLSAASTKELTGTARRKAFITIAIGALLVAIPLAATSIRVATETTAELQTQRFVQLWLDQTDFRVNKVEADGRNLTVLISGSGDIPALDELGTALQSTLGPRIKMYMRVVPSKTLHYPELESD
jgi:hypothetical protein